MSVEPRDDHAQLTTELQRLRRGHGLLSRELVQEIAGLPILQRICGVQPGMQPGEQRRRIIERISVAVLRLPAESCLAVQAAFALPPASQNRFLKNRMEWLGDKIERDPRTALRRVEEGFELLAEQLLSEPSPGEAPPNDYAPDGWFVNRLRSIVMLHLDPVQLYEHRQITSTRDGLDRITVSWSVPDEKDATSSPLQVEMLYGGDLRPDTARSTPSYWTGEVQLPRALAAGDRHEYQVRVTSLPRDRLHPYYVLTPFRRFDEFVLRAKFDPECVPEPIWRLNGVPFLTLEDPPPESDVLLPNQVGEAEITFRNLRHGLSYGLRWRKASGTPC